MNKMRPETSNNSKTTSSTNSCSTDDDNSNNNDHDQRIGAYCTLRSNKSNDLKHQQLNDNFETNKIDLKNHYCTISKRLKDLIKTEPIDCNSLVYKKLQDQISNEQRTSQSSSINNFGLSNNLSTESIKNACDYFELTDDDDDDDLIMLNDQKKHVEAVNNSLLEKLENRFSNIKRSSLSRQSTKSVTFDRKKKLDHFHPYCTIRRDKNPIITNSTIENKQINNSCLLTTIYPIINNDRDSVNNDLDVINESSIKYHNQDSIEAFNILSELDAILDNHDEKLQITSLTPSSISPYHNEPEKIEDCLLELDAYLEGIDDSISINSNNHELDIFKEIPSNNNQILEQENQTNINKRQFQRSRTLPKKIIRSRSRKNVPNNLVNSFVNPQYDHQQMENLKGLEHHHEEIHDNALNMDLKRQHKFRNTIDVPRRSKIDREDDHSSDILKDKSPIERQKSWRRNSMRKTSLLKLPDHKQNNTILKNDISSQLTNFNKSKLEYGESSTISSPNLIDNSLQTINLNRISNSIPNLTATSIDDITINKNINKLEENRINNSIIYNNNNNNINNNQTNNNNLLENINSTESNHNNNDLSNSLSQVESNQRQDLSHIDIINDILNNSLSSDTNQTLPARPRQFGRRAQANPRVVSIMAETNEAGNQRIIINHDRPISAPATAITNQNICTDERTTSLQLVTSQQAPNNARYIGSEPSSVGSSRNPSPVSLLSSTASSSMGSGEPEQTTTESQDQRTDSPDETPNNITNGNSIQNNNNSQWPHGFSRILALLCCTLGLFNISRFAIITIHYGGSFLIQFVFLSIIFGIPMLWLQMCLGTKIKSGPITMWKISPICKGIGISLLLVQFCIAIYSTISLGWILIYFRDSFVTRNDRYRWQDTLSIYRGQSNITDITKNLIDYFNGMVLQRWELSAKDNVDSGGIRFQLAFNLAVIWTFVFIILCKGLQSFGKIVLGLTLLPMILFIIVCSKLLYLIDITTVQNIYNSSDFDTFLTDSKSWAAAAQESFLTWGWLGSSVIAISSKSAEKSEGKTILRRDAFLVVILTFFGLTLSALLGYACIRILNDNGYAYMPGSYENLKCGQFISALEPGTYLNFVTIPGKWSPHYSSIMGDTYMITNRQLGHSGYQSLRLITELFPATLSIATQEQISPVWCIMGYLMFLLFGLAQLCAMWKPITNILGNSIPSTLISCITGFLLGIPFATEYGIQIIYYLEIVIGGSWWILVLWTGHILGIFLIRGRPYTSDIIVGDLNVYAHLQAFLGLSWNLLLPIGLITLSIIEYKLSYSNELYNWRRKGYFQLWTRKIGSLVQITFLLLIPIVAIIQIYRYLSKGPPDLLDRIQLLYRPIPTPPPHRRNRSNIERYPLPQVAISLTNLESQVQDDAPPKYTPPPSYTTATGARIAKMLRQSIRRSVRRILGGGETSRQRPTISTGSIPIHDTALPPEYSTVLSNPSGNDAQPEIGPRILYNSYTQRTLSLERNCPNDYPISLRSTSPSSSLSSQFLRQNNNDNDNNNKTNRIQGNRNAQTFTAFDVAQILRSSQRHQRSASAIATRMDNAIRCSSLRYNNNKNSRSVENLVLNAAPLGESNAITLSSETPNNDENTSVI